MAAFVSGLDLGARGIQLQESIFGKETWIRGEPNMQGPRGAEV